MKAESESIKVEQSTLADADADDPLAGTATRQLATATAFVEIVETLVGDFDIIDVLTRLTSRCVELLDAAAAGILLADSNGQLRVVGASTEEIDLLELFQIQNNEGPCLGCFHTGQVILHSDSDIVSTWPQFAHVCLDAGYASVCAVPLRLKSQIFGCLNLFMTESDGIGVTDVALAQALADVASIAIIQDQAARDARIRAGRLEHAMLSRIVIEQAKGMIAQRHNVGMDEAFSSLRSYARDHNSGLTEICEAVVNGALTVDAIAPRPRSTTPP